MTDGQAQKQLFFTCKYVAAIARNNEGLDGVPKITNGIKHDFPFSYRRGSRISG